jgi:ATP-binding cassette subfamily B protein
MIKLFKQYKWWLALLLLFSAVANALSLFVPKQVSKYIDLYRSLAEQGLPFATSEAAWIIGGIAVAVLILTFLQFFISTRLAEKVAYDVRNSLIGSIKKQTYSYISDTTSSKLLTNMTADVDAVKDVVSQGLVGTISALITFIGVIILLLIINWKMALITFTIIPFLILTFALVFGKLGALFKGAQENMEKIYKVINESIIGASLVRVLNAGSSEISKFDVVNTKSKSIGLQILGCFAFLIPVVTLLANLTTVIILWFGGRYVVSGALSLGELTAFFAYSAMFIWPIFVFGFSGPMFSRAKVAYDRIKEVLDAPIVEGDGIHTGTVKGDIEFRNINLQFGMRNILKDVSFSIKPNTRNAIVGPTAAGKTQLFYLLAGLIKQNSGDVIVDGKALSEWDHESYLGQIGLVFQDSIVFNTTLRENVDFRMTGDEAAVRKALRVAELGDLLKTLPKGLETVLNERGTNLSGGQKQRLMLARALAQEPKILLLDDFTARVDMQTEQAIIQNIKSEYPDLTLISITQKIDPIKDYDQVIVLMEGEVIDQGKHEELINRSVEYKQIYQSQQKAH